MVNLPFPESLDKECLKAAKTLRSFRMPQSEKGVDKFIPNDIIDKAKGLVVMTVVKAGFLFSGRMGFGLVVSKLPTGEWSAPSAIGTGSFGAGLQIGAELTDFVIILNNRRAVEAFTVGGNVAIGGNLSVAAGPTGRNAEANGMATLAAIYSYSKTKGLFAGISIEGTVFVERADANEKMYGRRVHARQLLSGEVPPPPEAYSLYEALKLRTSDTSSPTTTATAGTWEEPLTDQQISLQQSQQQQQPQQPQPQYPPSNSATTSMPPYSSSSASSSSSTPSPYPRVYPTNSLYPPPGYSPAAVPPPSKNSPPPGTYQVSSTNSGLSNTSSNNSPPQQYNHRPLPAVPPVSNRGKETEEKAYPKAKVLYDYAPQEAGDLPLRKGQIIDIIEKTETTNGWWVGRDPIKRIQGSFPGNYVQELF